MRNTLSFAVFGSLLCLPTVGSAQTDFCKRLTAALNAQPSFEKLRVGKPKTKVGTKTWSAAKLPGASAAYVDEIFDPFGGQKKHVFRAEFETQQAIANSKKVSPASRQKLDKSLSNVINEATKCKPWKKQVVLKDDYRWIAEGTRLRSGEANVLITIRYVSQDFGKTIERYWVDLRIEQNTPL